MRKAFANKLVEMAQRDDKLVVLIGDISHYLLKEFEEKYPDRFYNVGICEQSIIGMAAGLAMEGFRPVVHTIAPFCVQRAFEQVKIDLCYQSLDVTIVSVGGSFDYAHLGCTHHCYEDISILRTLPNMHIFAPGSSYEFETLFEKTWNNGFPKYFKLIADQHSEEFEVEPYKCNILQKSSDSEVVIFVSGFLLDVVLKTNSNSTVVYVPTISPMEKASRENIVELVKNHKAALVVEENSLIGGLGDQIFHIISEAGLSAKIKKIGIPNQFLEEYGKADQHREHIGLTMEDISKAIWDIRDA